MSGVGMDCGSCSLCIPARITLALTVLRHTDGFPPQTPVTTLPRASSGSSACAQDRQEVLGMMPPGLALSYRRRSWRKDN